MNNGAIAWSVLGIVVLVVAVFGLFWGFPQWNAWRAGLSGQAQLNEATFNRQIAVEEAQAELDAADLKAQADIIRARGLAEANNIIAGSITEEFIRWKWVEGLNDESSQVIYVPTEGNLPILEAGKR